MRPFHSLDSPAAAALRCQGRKTDGTPCNLPPLKGSTLRRFHDPRPEVVQARLEASSRGGLGNPKYKGIELPEFDPGDIGSIREFRMAAIRAAARGAIDGARHRGKPRGRRHGE